MRRSSSPRAASAYSSRMRSSASRLHACAGMVSHSSSLSAAFFLFAPQMHQTQVSAHGQQPTNGRSGGPVLLCAIPHLDIDILGQILGIVCVFEVRQRKVVYGCFCALIQLCQCFTLPSGNAEKQLLQLELIFRGIFSCHQHTEHGLLSPAICVMREAGGLLHGLKNFMFSVASFSEDWNTLMY